MADQGAEGLLSPWLRKKRFEVARPHLYGRSLDFGCSSGGLAELVPSDLDFGVDVVESALEKARSQFPKHQFVSKPPQLDIKFDSMVSLSVIERVSDPVELLCTLAAYLSDSDEARLIVTTPHPSVDWIHDLGAAVGLFSKHANEEHKDLLDREKLKWAGAQAGLQLTVYRRFRFDANQLVFRRASR